MDSIWLFVKDFLTGLKDSLLGVSALKQIDKQIEKSQPSESFSPSKYQSILAQRRAEKKREWQTSGENSIQIAKKKETVLERLLNCCILNGGFCCVAYLMFLYLVKPNCFALFSLLTGSQEVPWIAEVFLGLFSSLYFIPILLLSKLVNLVWFQDIAEASYRKVRGRPRMQSLGLMLADLFFSFFLQSLFLFQAQLTSFIVSVYLLSDNLANLAYLFHMSLLYSLYAFEYKWFLMGWPVEMRISYLEKNWIYFAGFGLPLGFLTHITTSFYSSSFLLAFVFPMFIVSANEAKTLPSFNFFPLKLFTPSSKLTDFIFKKLIKRGSKFYPSVSFYFKFIFKYFIILFYYISIPVAYVSQTLFFLIRQVINKIVINKKLLLLIVIIILVLILVIFFLILFFY